MRMRENRLGLECNVVFVFVSSFGSAPPAPSGPPLSSRPAPIEFRVVFVGAERTTKYLPREQRVCYL